MKRFWLLLLLPVTLVCGEEYDNPTPWSYQRITRHPIPAVKDAAWPKDDIDRFILARLEKENLHPITILTLPDKDNNMVACKMLIDQCCTDNHLISWELVKALKLPTSTRTPLTFHTAGGKLVTDKLLKRFNAMLPFLSTTHTFTLKLPKNAAPN